MKKSLFFALAATVLAGCASDEIVDVSVPNIGSTHADIRFTTNRQNMTRANSPLQKNGHYNFGVFAYKSTDAVNNIMDNYLVGYNDAANKKGYYMTVGNQTTLGDVPGSSNGTSQWAYEMLGSAEYNYTGSEGYYTKDQIQYMSNNANQYLRYWDLASETTSFYAYAPYINGGGTAVYTNNDHKLTIPNGSFVAQMIEGDATPEACEYMVAATQVANTDYGKDVELNFTRLNAKVNIKFWEDIQGYSVKILDLTDAYGVAAAPAIATTANDVTSYTKEGAKYFESTGIIVDFSNVTAPSFAWDASATENSDPLNFSAPSATAIGTTRLEASPSASTYYAIPKNNTTGFTFRVSYELTSTTGERITVRNASVHVPVTYTNWVMNTHYTYIFKITKGSNGTTIDPNDPDFPGIDPSDPTVDPENALYPIVFDNCTIEDWVENESDYIISDGTDTRDYSVVLSTNSVKASEGGTIDVKLMQDDNDITNGQTFTLTMPTGATGVTLSESTVTVASNATAGVYTVSWENTNSNHSPAKTYSAQFTVIGNYAVSVSTAYIGTNGLASTTLQASTTEAGVEEITPDGNFSIGYPTGIPSDKKNQVTVNAVGLVTVEPGAYAGVYKVVYTTAEGDATADFTIADYGFSLASGSIGLNVNGSSVAYTAANALPAGASAQVTIVNGNGVAESGITVGNGVFNVASTVTPGIYTITKTVNNSGSITSYQQTLEVMDIYTLSLDKTVVDNDNNVTIQVTATKNGVSNVADVVYPTDSGFEVDNSAGTIKVLNTCAAGTYTVKNGTETVTFEVQD